MHADFTEPRHHHNWLMQALLHISQNMPETWLGRRIAFLMRRIFRLFNDDRPVEVLVWGARMLLHPSGNVAEKRILFTPNYFDPIERGHLQRVIRPGFVFFDIGANIGGYTLFVAAQAPNDSVIVAVEPQPVIKERLAHNCWLNTFSNVILIEKALSDHTGSMLFRVDSKNLGESGLALARADDGSYISVEVEPLFNVVQSVGVTHIDAMKIDVEGYEEPVLTAFLNTAPPDIFPKLLIVENGRDRWNTDLVTFILSHGYKLKEATRLNFVFERE